MNAMTRHFCQRLARDDHRSLAARWAATPGDQRPGRADRPARTRRRTQLGLSRHQEFGGLAETMDERSNIRSTRQMARVTDRWCSPARPATAPTSSTRRSPIWCRSIYRSATRSRILSAGAYTRAMRRWAQRLARSRPTPSTALDQGGRRRPVPSRFLARRAGAEGVPGGRRTRKKKRSADRILMIGFGPVGHSTLPLIIRPSRHAARIASRGRWRGPSCGR